MDIPSEISFYGSACASPLHVISDLISYKIPPQMKMLNMIISILMHNCMFVSNWCVASGIKARVIQRNVT